MKKKLQSFIGCADLHIRKKRPKNRVDNFYLSEKRKIAWLFKTANEYDAYILAAGDIFDTSTQPYNAVKDYIALCLKYNVKLITIFGQHDLRYHSYVTRDNTPLGVLQAALFPYVGSPIEDAPLVIKDKIRIVGRSWEQQLPAVEEGMFNILLTHELVVPGNFAFPGCKKFTQGLELVGHNEYNVIISGDNHASFSLEKKGKHLFNTGSIMRLNIDQYNYEPRVLLFHVYDDFSIEYEWLPVPIKEKELVFAKISDADKTDTANALSAIVAFVSSLGDYVAQKPDFIFNLNQAKGKLSEKPLVQDMIDTIILKATALQKVK